MTEQELRERFRDHFDCYADSTIVAQAMTEDSAVELAKAYADAKVAEKNAEIAETRRKFELCKLMQSSSVDVLCAYDTEIAELKAESKYWNDRWEALNQANDAEFSSIIAQNAENKRLNAEIKRLREGVQKAMEYLSGSQNGNPEPSVIYDMLSSISPAPVTSPLNEDQHE